MPQARDEAGNIWETDAQGNPVRLVQAAGQAPQMPAKPGFELEGDKAAADLTGARLGNRKDATEADILEATRGAAIREANAKASSAETAAQVAAEERSSGGKMSEAQAQQKAKAASLIALRNQINDLYRRYVEGPGQTEGIAGLGDYFPSETGANFDTAGAQMADIAGAAFRVPGAGTTSDADVARFVAANQPSRWDRDSVSLQKIDAIQGRLNDTARELGVDLPSPWIPQGGVAKGELSSEAGAYSTPQDRDNATAIFDAYAKGASLDDIMGLMQTRGMPTEGEREQWLPMIQYRDQKRGLGTVEPAKSGDRGGGDAFLGSAINNPVGGAVAGATNMLGMGALESFAPEQYQAMGDQGGWTGNMMVGGEVLGAVGGTQALGKIGGNMAARYLPKLMGGGKSGMFGRGVATDTAYGGGYGAVTGDDPLASAGLAAIGSTGGTLIGKAGGRALSGFNRTSDAAFLNSRGVPTTFGQDVGGFTKSIEDASTSIPGAGDLVNARRLEGVEGFNRAAFDTGGELVGARGMGYGAEGIDGLNAAKNRAYSNALDPVTIDATDPALINDLGATIRGARQIPNVNGAQDAAMSALQSRINGAVDPSLDTISGRGFQEAYRGLARTGRERMNGDYGFEIGETMRQGQDSLAGALERQNPGAFGAFKDANGTNRRLMTLATAVNAGKNTDELFAPAQLNAADSNATKRLSGPLAAAGGDRPFYELAMAGQSVLPSKLPDSGTARRAALMAAGSAFGAGTIGAGAGAAGPGDPMTLGLGGFSLAAALALASTKAGQKVLKKSLIDRPATVKAIGSKVRKRAGLLGSATVPFALEGQ